MILDEFLVKLGVISDPKDLDTFVAGLQKAATVATAVVGVVGGATAAITKFFGAALEGLDSLNDLAQDTDTDLAYIQKLGYAAQLSGSSVEAANASIKGLARSIGEAASGLGRGKQAFEAYGLSAKNADGSVKSVGEVLDEVQAKMVGLAKSEQLSMLNKLGIDQTMIGLLNSTNAQMGELFQQAEDLGLVTAAGADAAGEFNDTMDQMNMVMGAIRTNIAVGLAPQLTNIVGRLRDWLIRNKELIRGGIDKTVTVILSLWRAIMRAVDVIDLIIERTIGWKAALVILGGTLAWLNRTMLLAFATNPITLIATAIAGLILLVDDLMTYLEGGDSMFDWSWAVPIIESVGEAIDSVGVVLRELWAKYGQNVKDELAGLWKFMEGLFNWLGNSVAAVFKLMMGDFDGFLAHGLAAMEGLKQMFEGASEYIQAAWAILSGLLGQGIDAVGDRFAAVWESVKRGFAGAMDFISGLWTKVSGMIGAGIDRISGAIGWLGEKLGMTSEVASSASSHASQSAQGAFNAPAVGQSGSPEAGGNGERTTENKSTVQVTQHISTSDPKAAGEYAAQEIKRQQQRASANASGAFAY